MESDSIMATDNEKRHCPTSGMPCAMQDTITQIATDVRSIKEILDGGSKPSDGMIVRLDRLEQREGIREKVADRNQNWIIAAFGVGGLGFLTALWTGLKQLLRS